MCIFTHIYIHLHTTIYLCMCVCMYVCMKLLYRNDRENAKKVLSVARGQSRMSSHISIYIQDGQDL